MKSIDRFDPGRGYAFTSFAVPTIVGELRRHFRDRTWAVRRPRDLQELSLRIDRAASMLAQKLDHTPTVAELARSAGCREEEVVEGLRARAGRSALSLHAESTSASARCRYRASCNVGSRDCARSPSSRERLQQARQVPQDAALQAGRRARPRPAPLTGAGSAPDRRM